MDKATKINEKGTGITPTHEIDIISIIRNSLQ